MARKGIVKKVVGAGVIASAGYALWRSYQSRRSLERVQWEPQPFPFPPSPAPPPVASAPASTNGRAAWVEPVDGECPPGYPVKAKLTSGIFHMAGDANYERTRPDRCYRDAEAALADGLRAPKR